jgi:hypothetical protein
MTAEGYRMFKPKKKKPKKKAKKRTPPRKKNGEFRKRR